MNVCEALKSVDKKNGYINRPGSNRKIVVVTGDRKTDFYTLLSCGCGRGLNLSFEDFTTDDWEAGTLSKAEEEKIQLIKTECGWY